MIGDDVRDDLKLLKKKLALANYLHFNGFHLKLNNDQLKNL